MTPNLYDFRVLFGFNPYGLELRARIEVDNYDHILKGSQDFQIFMKYSKSDGDVTDSEHIAFPQL